MMDLYIFYNLIRFKEFKLSLSLSLYHYALRSDFFLPWIFSYAKLWMCD
jgi:hypothetical protein